MDWQTALRARLVEDQAVADLVEGRVYWVQRPQGAALPCIVLQAFTLPWEEHLKGRSGPFEARVQVDAMAVSRGGVGGYDLAWRVSRAAQAALLMPGTFSGVRFARASPEGERDLGEKTDTQFINRVSGDLLVRFYGDVQ